MRRLLIRFEGRDMVADVQDGESFTEIARIKDSCLGGVEACCDEQDWMIMDIEMKLGARFTWRFHPDDAELIATANVHPNIRIPDRIPA